MGDPRVYFAAEQTLLAWIRTGLTIMGFGFVVSRFALFIRLMSLMAPPQVALHAHGTLSTMPTYLGVALVAMGTIAVLVASLQHRRFVAHLPREDRPTEGMFASMSVSVGICAVGTALAIYLVASY